jgi:hypothetical protein
MDAENGPVDVLFAELALRQHGVVARRQLEPADSKRWTTHVAPRNGV